MDAMEKAKIRLEHWIAHNNDHQRDYELFAQDLAESGKTESAAHIREMIDLNSKCTECLRRALQALGEENLVKK